MKNQTIHLRRRAWRTLAGAFALAAVVSCGGGGDGVVGSGGTGVSAGLAVGTVNGFGSVIVDGVSYDNRNAPVLREVAPGQDAVAEVKLGDRVSVAYETAGIAKSVRIEAALSGAATSAVSADQFSILGQTVTLNANVASGPVTQLSGFAKATDIQPGHALEVHGMLVRRGNTYTIQATRIEKLDVLPAYLRVTGQVSRLGAAGALRFELGALAVDATRATLLPAGASLANGQTVTVLALPATLTPPIAGMWRLQAAQVAVRELQGGELDDYVSGSISHLDVQAKTLTLGSLRVNYANASLTPPATTLANGQYVRVQGRADADGSLLAGNLTLRDADSDTEAELRGNILDLDTAALRFTVRGVRVDALAAQLQGCPAGGLVNGLFVEVEGTLSNDGVVANKVHCEDEPSDATVEREGVARSVDLTGSSFNLVPEHGAAIAVRWTAATYFGGVRPQTLAGKAVHVEGSIEGGVIVASKIKHDD